MNCNQSNDYMMQYFDGTLDDIKNAQLKHHMKTCKACSFEFEKMNEVINCIEKDFAIEPPEDFEEQIMKKVEILEQSRKKQSEKVIVFLYSLVTLLLSLAAIALFASVKGISVYGAVENLALSFNSLSSTLSVINKIFEALVGLITLLASALFEVLILLIKSYYYAFILIAGMIFAVQRLLTRTENQKSGGTR